MATKFRGMSNKNPVPNQLSQQVQVKFQQALALHQHDLRSDFFVIPLTIGSAAS
ncbi:MAG TPA: hypothetical protein VGQ54_16980 [Burkholderiales bacterium]|nr:hypothetical protein [Burkholderiales bacterium]